MKFKSVKGAKDILPEDIFKWHFVEQKIRSIMHTFNYREIRTPVFEETALFSRGIGELTDIVGKEMYTFPDRSGTSLTLKPEMTAAVMRAYLQNNLGEQQPLTKVYYISPMFRQERPQAGRLRQFHQFGAESIGSSNPTSDAEIISLSNQIYKSFEIRNFKTSINSVGCEKCRPQYKEILKNHLMGFAQKRSEESQKRLEQNPLRILDSKNETDRELTKNAPLVKDHLCEECANHFSEVQQILNKLNVPYSIDGRIVRGLDYYTKTAYEIVSSDLGSQDALAGGGRYDLLVEQIGGKITPSVGFAAGIERLLMTLEKGNVFSGNDISPDVFIAAADDLGKIWAIETAMKLRNVGIPSEIDFLNRSLKAQMREADRQKARFVIVAGATEIEKQSFTIKNMQTGVQMDVPSSEILNHFQNETR